MARKVTVDLTDAVGTFMTKTNQISDYIGDLDDLDSTFSGADTSVVDALNRMGDLTDSINERLFGESAGPLHMQGINCDSASFNLIRAGQLLADSATIDSAFIRNLDVDFLMVDSARIERLTVSEAIIDSAMIDSATIQRLRAPNLLADSAHINTLTTHNLSTDSAYFDVATIETLHVNNLTVDSAHIETLTTNTLTTDSARIETLTTNTLTTDSAYFDMATIENTFVTTLYMDDAGNVQRALDNLKLFTVKNEAGTVVLGGFFLSTSNVVSVP